MNNPTLVEKQQRSSAFGVMGGAAHPLALVVDDEGLALSGGERPADLAMERAAHPQSAGLLPKTPHRRRHSAKARRSADDNEM